MSDRLIEDLGAPDPMRRIRKIVKVLMLLTLALLLVAGAADLYCEYCGIPMWLKNHLELKLHSQGLDVTSHGIYAGVVNGVIVDRPTVRLPGESLPLLTADSAVLTLSFWKLLRNDPTFPATLVVSNASVQIPLDDNTHVPLTQTELRLRFFEHGIELQRLETRFENVALTVRGEIDTKRPPELRAPGTSRPLGVTLRTLLPKLDARTLVNYRNIRQFARALGDSSRIEVTDLAVALAAPGNATGKVDCFLSDLKHGGLHAERIFGTMRFGPERLWAESFDITLQSGGRLHGSFGIDRLKQEAAGEFDFCGDPMTLLAQMDPNAREQLHYIHSFARPVNAKVLLVPSSLKTPEAWEWEVELSASDLWAVGVHILSVDGRVKVRGGNLEIISAKARVVPDTDIFLTGRLTPEPMTLLDATVNGDPRVIGDFILDADARSAYAAIWDDFKWQERTYCQVQFFVRPVNGRLEILVNGHAEMHDCSYRGIHLDHVSADFFVDGQDNITVIDNLDIQIDKRRARSRLMWDYHSARPAFHYQFSSDLESKDLLGIVNPEWDEVLTAWGVEIVHAPTLTQCYGQIGLRRHNTPADQPQQWDVKLVAHFPELTRTRDTRLQQTTAYMHGTEKGVSIHFESEEMSHREWELRNLVVDANYLNDDWIITAKLPHITDQQMKLLNADIVTRHQENTWVVTGTVPQLSNDEVEMTFNRFKAVLSDNDPAAGWRVSSETEQIKLGALRLDGVNANSTLVGNKFDSTINLVKNASYQTETADFRFRQVIGTVSRDAAGYVAKLAIETVAQCDVATAYGVQTTFAREVNGPYLFSGTMKRLEHDASRSVLEDVEFSGKQEKEALMLDKVTAKHAEAGDDWRGRGLVANARAANGTLSIDATFEQLRWKKDYTAANVTAAITREKEVYCFDVHWPAIHSKTITLEEVHTKGTYQDETLTSAVRAASAEIREVEFTAVETHLRVQKSGVDITDFKAGFYQGTALGEIHYSFPKDMATIKLDATGFQIKQFLKQEHAAGLCNFNCSVNAKRPTTAMALFGVGRINVHEADLYHIPYFTDFMSWLSKLTVIREFGGLGRITKLDADLEFVENRVQVHNLKTDGHIVSITADGTYDWKTEDVDFLFEVVPLKQIGIVTRLLALKRRLKGTKTNPEWESLIPNPFKVLNPLGEDIHWEKIFPKPVEETNPTQKKTK